jgi:3-oxoacyl-[acyl-carrier-protein] synthase II
MKKRVAITGVGVVCSLGDSSSLLHRKLCEGVTGLALIAATQGFETHPAGKASTFEPELYLKGRPLRPIDRTGRLLASATTLALESSGWDRQRLAREDVGLVLGTMFGSMHTIARFDRQAIVGGPGSASPMDFANTVINSAAGQTAIWHKLRGINSTTATGATSGLMAIGYAADLIRYGQHTAIVAGGADEFCLEAFSGFESAGWLCGPTSRAGCSTPFDRQRTGFALGEAAALLVLEERESALSRGASVWGEVQGHANAYNPAYDHSARSAAAIIRAMQGALEDARMAPACIDGISAAANGSVVNDENEGLAIQAVFNGGSRHIPVTAIKSMLGETLGAAGVLQIIDYLETIRTSALPGIVGLKEVAQELDGLNLCRQATCIHPTTGMINSVGFDGHACSLILSAP